MAEALAGDSRYASIDPASGWIILTRRSRKAYGGLARRPPARPAELRRCSPEPSFGHGAPMRVLIGWCSAAPRPVGAFWRLASPGGAGLMWVICEASEVGTLLGGAGISIVPSGCRRPRFARPLLSNEGRLSYWRGHAADRRYRGVLLGRVSHRRLGRLFMDKPSGRAVRHNDWSDRILRHLPLPGGDEYVEVNPGIRRLKSETPYHRVVPCLRAAAGLTSSLRPGVLGATG